jgi:hypothetical protein
VAASSVSSVDRRTVGSRRYPVSGGPTRIPAASARRLVMDKKAKTPKKPKQPKTADKKK